VKLTLESTNQITTINGAKARVWKGRTEKGVACVAFITNIGVPRGADSAEFERELVETQPPAGDCFIDLRLIS
jgi:hypothetical protein